MLNRSGITKTSYSNIKQILANVELQSSVGCIVPQSLGVTVGSKKIAKAGTPININLKSTNTPVQEPSDSVSESATATVSGTGISAATVVAETFGGKVSSSGTYEFTNDGTNWNLNGSNVTLGTYGITATGTAASGDKITVVYVAAGSSAPMNAVLLHDVDVTAGTANGTALIFGFVNLNRVDADVATEIDKAVAIEGASQKLTFMRV